MKFSLSIGTNSINFMRRVGYSFQRNTDSGQQSFIRPLARGGYPRFHAYVTQDSVELHISIHIDHKKHTYGSATRHHGEYEDSGALSEEVERIKSFVNM